MPKFELTISDRLLGALQEHVQRYNDNTGKNLTVKEWLKLHLKDVVIQKDMTAFYEQKQEQKREAMEAELRVEGEVELERRREELD